MKEERAKKVDITILLPAGRLQLDLLAAAAEMVKEHGIGLYLSNAQNLRLLGVPEDAAEQVKENILGLGYQLKGPGKFPLPRVCIGQEHCTLAVADPEQLSQKILARFATRSHTKAKFKIAIAGCSMCCSDVKTTDIGIMATRDGYEVYAGGKGGPFPHVGRRIARKVDDERVLAIVGELVDYHDCKTEKKQRMYKLLGKEGFPFPEV